MPPATDNGRPATDFVSRHPLAATCLLCAVWILPGLFARDPAKATALSKQRAEAAAALARAEEDWLNASAAYENATA